MLLESRQSSIAYRYKSLFARMIISLFHLLSLSSRNNVVACAKHFVGDGGTTEGINESNTVIDTHGLLSIHMPPYYDSVIKGVSTVMVSYTSWNNKKMHSNRDLISTFLKDTLNFKVDFASKILCLQNFNIINNIVLVLFYHQKKS